ncbi:probable magnesium transporter NIPA6 isoform X3 [Cucumis melo]|uniref:Probable magnesium transporter n=1 Tax=Cucumis melo TaxID=3656 RepID=A0A1S3BJL3_CUCME|nr:probable magnesium transporter NIPA6 isoform X3 [Cucumis melo]XP_050946420.1 probable magnesium transporter NIPA6 isoform X3 [Cucumis melo]XP_050946421.1 probable magnesium transporter NIPA6 isoform X3 [Cucumis melo]XP_050946422.1 probable magnesium transporter NIPA6 isoform X3 [Cucumis melo]
MDSEHHETPFGCQMEALRGWDLRCWRLYIPVRATLVGRHDHNDYWRDCKLCSIYLCPSSFSHTPWCTEHYCQEHTPDSVEEIWDLATQPAFLVYIAAIASLVLALMLYFEPRYGHVNILVYLGICSLMGSLTVMSIKAIGIAIRLTLEGISQVAYPQTWLFVTVAVVCVITQLNYLNKALDTFNAALVSPVYYAMFTTLTIIASAIMFKDWSGQNASTIVSELCGFITVLSGTIILHSTREQQPVSSQGSVAWYISGDSMKSIEEHLITISNSHYTEE